MVHEPTIFGFNQAVEFILEVHSWRQMMSTPRQETNEEDKGKADRRVAYLGYLAQQTWEGLTAIRDALVGYKASSSSSGNDHHPRSVIFVIQDSTADAIVVLSLESSRCVSICPT